MAVPARKSSGNRPRKRNQKREISKLEDIVLQLYGRGLLRTEIAKLLSDQFETGWEHDHKRHMKAVRSRLRQMEDTQWFRDELWRRTSTKTDLAAPIIMEGVVEKAKRGDIPAAKFALEIAGRYSDSVHNNVAEVNVVFAGVPRPDRSHLTMEGQPEADVVEADAEEGEWQDV